MRRRVATATLMAFLGIVATVTHAATVRFDRDTSADFSAWRTLAWRDDAPATDATIAEGRIRRELEEGLAGRGYTWTERKSADLLIDYQGGVHRDLRVDESWGPPRWGRQLRVEAVPAGVLVVDVLEARSGRLVWRGMVSDALASDPEKADARLRKAVTKLLAKLPAVVP